MKNRISSFVSKLTTVALFASMFSASIPVQAAQATNISVVLTRQKISTVSDWTIRFTLPAGVNFDFTGGVLQDKISFVSAAYVPSGITATTDFTFSDGTVRAVNNWSAGPGFTTVSCTDGANNVGVALDTSTGTMYFMPCGSSYTPSATGATVTIAVLGTAPDIILTNNAVAASYAYNGAMTDEGVANAVTGGGNIPIVTDDQVAVTATVSPSMTFNVGAEASGTPCAVTFSGNGGTVALGTLATGSVTSSDVASVNHICTRLSSNATGGSVVTVKSLNASLKSTSVPGDTIPSAGATMAAGTANYGLCASATESGQDSTTPAGGTMSRTSPFNGTCAAATAGGVVGALTTSAQSIWSVNNVTSNAFWRIHVKAAISGTTPAHNDYGDTLTFIATGTF